MTPNLKVTAAVTCVAPAVLWGQGWLRASQWHSFTSQQPIKEWFCHQDPPKGESALAAEQPLGKSRGLDADGCRVPLHPHQWCFPAVGVDLDEQSRCPMVISASWSTRQQEIRTTEAGKLSWRRDGHCSEDEKADFPLLDACWLSLSVS